MALHLLIGRVKEDFAQFEKRSLFGHGHRRSCNLGTHPVQKVLFERTWVFLCFHQNCTNDNILR